MSEWVSRDGSDSGSMATDNGIGVVRDELTKQLQQLPPSREYPIAIMTFGSSAKFSAVISGAMPSDIWAAPVGVSRIVQSQLCRRPNAHFHVTRPMPKQSRKHHYVPKFYLAGFTDSGTVDGDLHVVDTTRSTKWSCKPKEAAHRRDFYEIDVGPNINPMHIETILGHFETKWSTVLRRVVEQHSLPADDAFGDLMMFIAFMAVRVPRIRETISNFLEEVRRKEEFARKWLEQQGHQVAATTNDFEAFDQTWHVQEMIRLAIGLGPLLSLRHWNLWIVEDQAPDLICSDSPVVPTWATSTSGLHSPGFGTANTVVSMPLGKRVVLVSMLDVDVGPRMLGRDEVAQLNSATGMYAGQLYCPAPDFVWLTSDGRVGNRDDLLQALGGNPA